MISLDAHARASPRVVHADIVACRGGAESSQMNAEDIGTREESAIDQAIALDAAEAGLAGSDVAEGGGW